ncbi:hypothetical protein J3E74DRAFT_443226, partial [Bipolaris maydis]
ITTSAESRQIFIDNLATEHGLARVRQIVETNFSMPYSVLNPMFDPHCILFLHIISNEEIRHSLVLEKAVGTIYNVIYGYDGNRGIGFFRNVTDCLAQMTSEVNGRRKVEDALFLATAALLTTLTLNQGAAIKTEFKKVVEQLCICYDAKEINYGSSSLNVRSAHENILKIKDILHMGDTISASNAANSHATTTSRKKQPELPHREPHLDLPGELSQWGPRHDNDHALISDIKILPTLSEILCNQRADFLPQRHNPGSPSIHHETGVLQLLDSQFRLLREDTSGLLRDSIRLILENWTTFVHNSDWRIKRKILRDGSPTPVRIYSDVEIQRIKSNTIKGVEIEVQFEQARRARHPNLMRRKQWWYESRGLREGGAILAVIDGEPDDITVIFLQVSKREICTSDHDDESGIHDLASDAKRAMITLRLAGPNCKADLSSLVYLASDTRRSFPSPRPLMLVEFPAVLYNSFEGILRCLQSLHTNPTNIPFTTWLAPRAHDKVSIRESATDYSHRGAFVPPPAYLGSAILDLSCISTATGNDSNSATTPLTMSISHDPHMLSTRLSEVTTLDTGQATAMISALRHEIALIQGPPGTGKSYVGIQIARVLLNNRDLLGLGPILCVCYTNHALDQFLHELLDSGVTNILRAGSRSPSPRLEALSLENYKRNGQIPRIPGLGKRISDCRASMEKLSMEIQRVCRQIQESNVRMVKGFLKKRFAVQAVGIFGGISEELDAGLDSETRDDAAIETWVSGDAPGDLSGSDTERSIDQLLLAEVWTLKNSERARLYQYWHDSALAELSQHFHDLVQRHISAKQQYTSLFNQSYMQSLDRFHIIGVTTTGLANNSDLLRGLRAKVLICEEAGEVLEAHVLTVLLPSIQHAILIGDHLQLRPRILNLKLSMEYDRAGPKYNLDESLFERLANSRFEDRTMNGEEKRGEEDQFPIAQLDHQRRMHPMISSLVRKTLYPKLRDHPDTTSYPEVSGMRRRLFWLDHRNVEDAGDPEDIMQSKTNIWEAKMVTALVRHLCRQGKYRPGEIAVLTPYMGQLRVLKDMLAEIVELIIGEKDSEELCASDAGADTRDSGMTKERSMQRRQWKQQQHQMVGKGKLLDELRVASVDNFQGEEATVIIVSLVRSNVYQNCGFLKTPNRINVLLSRAKHGMYIIGDAKTSSHVSMWSSVIELLEKGGNIGSKLELQCSRHPDNKIYVSSPDDFAIHAPEGGCAEKCGLRLSCGHSCAVKCHSTTLHEAVKCMELCTRVRECRHPCSKKCNTPCGECYEKILNVLLPCGHVAKEVECRNMENLAGVKCEHPVEREMPGCGHHLTVPCHENTTDFKCLHSCDSLLSCGHNCRKPCWNCMQTNDHGSCNIPCGRLFTICSHRCDHPCHDGVPCSPCNLPCETRCKHSRCPKKCSDPCAPCAEQCGWSCDHRRDRCSMPCAVPCDIIPCDRRCEKNLVSCGHQCPGVCGEVCPDSKFCRICCAPDILEQYVDFVMFRRYGEIEIDKDPLIFLSCGHFHTVSTLDGIMELTQHYVTDSQTGKIVSPKSSQRVVKSGSAPKGCPVCRKPLRDIDRYNQIIKKAFLDEATRRFVAQANSRCAELAEKIQNREMKIERERSEFVLQWLKELGELRGLDQVERALEAYQIEGIRLQKDIKKFTKSVEKTEQPFGRVNDLLSAALVRQCDITTEALKFDESVIQTGFQFRGQCLSLRLSWAILWDFDAIYSNDSVDPRIRSALRNKVASQIRGFLDRCLSLVNASQNAKFPQQEAEAWIYRALFSMLLRSNSRAQGQPVDKATEVSTRQVSEESLEEFERLFSRHPGSLAYLKDDAEKARRLVNGGTFYTMVTAEEKREVYMAMARQFSGTGHWYYCRNNHPFTVGECGMPMEEARCPQCEEPIGGHDHTPVQGVQRAEDIEIEF